MHRQNTTDNFILSFGSSKNQARPYRFTPFEARRPKAAEAVPMAGRPQTGFTPFKVRAQGAAAIKDGLLQTGFTLIELLVVIFIMGILASLVVVNIGGQQSKRNITLSSNELATNLRKVQSYSLSVAQVANGIVGKYYIMQLDLATSTQYTLKALYDSGNDTLAPTGDFQTTQLQSPIKLQALYTKRGDAAGTLSSNLQCVQVAFQAPFGTTILNEGCDWNNIASFDIAPINEPANFTSSNSQLAIQLTDSNNTVVKCIMVRGITGLVEQRDISLGTTGGCSSLFY